MTDAEINAMAIKVNALTSYDEVVRCCNLFSEQAASYYAMGSSTFFSDNARQYAWMALVLRIALLMRA